VRSVGRCHRQLSHFVGLEQSPLALADCEVSRLSFGELRRVGSSLETGDRHFVSFE